MTMKDLRMGCDPRVDLYSLAVVDKRRPGEVRKKISWLSLICSLIAKTYQRYALKTTNQEVLDLGSFKFGYCIGIAEFKN
jgi:hypothetical protein